MSDIEPAWVEFGLDYVERTLILAGFTMADADKAIDALRRIDVLVVPSFRVPTFEELIRLHNAYRSAYFRTSKAGIRWVMCAPIFAELADRLKGATFADSLSTTLGVSRAGGTWWPDYAEQAGRPVAEYADEAMLMGLPVRVDALAREVIVELYTKD